jgi:hypothetical protein
VSHLISARPGIAQTCSTGLLILDDINGALDNHCRSLSNAHQRSCNLGPSPMIKAKNVRIILQLGTDRPLVSNDGNRVQRRSMRVSQPELQRPNLGPFSMRNEKSGAPTLPSVCKLKPIGARLEGWKPGPPLMPARFAALVMRIKGVRTPTSQFGAFLNEK